MIGTDKRLIIWFHCERLSGNRNEIILMLHNADNLISHEISEFIAAFCGSTVHNEFPIVLVFKIK